MGTDLVGRQLGNYLLLQLLGEGGFAKVYLGEHIHLGTQAAIKVLDTRLTDDDKERFRIEARTIARLEHPHIVRVFDFGIEDGIPFLVMTYAPNGTLRQLHPKGTAVPLALVVFYVKEIADALQYAHSQRLIHRDIKPENLLLGRNKEILLSDFGIALAIQSSRYQSTKDMAGTITYMAPEQIEAHPRFASDQYSLGIIVYEWLSGERPFNGSWTEIAIKHSVVSPPSIRDKVPMLSSAIESVIFKALAKKPEQRFASVQAFAAALETAYQTAQELPPSYIGNRVSVQFPSKTLLPDQLSYPGSALASTMQSMDPRSQMTPPLQTSFISQNRFSSPSLTAYSPNRNKSIKREISRRTVVAGLAGLATVGIGVTWFSLYKDIPAQSLQTPIIHKHTSSPNTKAGPTAVPDPIQAHMGSVIGQTSMPVNSAANFTNPADGQLNILIHLPNGSFVAYDRACTHEAVLILYNPNTHMLVCPAHGSIFDPSNNARVLQGPAPTPVAKVPLRVNSDGTITTS